MNNTNPLYLIEGVGLMDTGSPNPSRNKITPLEMAVINKYSNTSDIDKILDARSKLDSLHRNLSFAEKEILKIKRGEVVPEKDALQKLEAMRQSALEKLSIVEKNYMYYLRHSKKSGFLVRLLDDPHLFRRITRLLKR